METNEQRQRKTHETELETNQLRTQPKTWQLTMLQVCFYYNDWGSDGIFDIFFSSDFWNHSKKWCPVLESH